MISSYIFYVSDQAEEKNNVRPLSHYSNECILNLSLIAILEYLSFKFAINTSLPESLKFKA